MPSTVLEYPSSTAPEVPSSFPLLAFSRYCCVGRAAEVLVDEDRGGVAEENAGVVILYDIGLYER